MISNTAFAISTFLVLSFFVATPIQCCSCGYFQPGITMPGLLKVRDLDVYDYEKPIDLINSENLQCRCRRTKPSFLAPKLDLAENLCAFRRKLKPILPCGCGRCLKMRWPNCGRCYEQ